MSFQVHQHRGRVAVYTGTGETAYYTPDVAMKLARAIELAATKRDVPTQTQDDDETNGYHVEIYGGDRYGSVAWFLHCDEAVAERDRLIMLGARVTKGGPA